jgi:predicted metal-dependent peptidase
LKISGSDYFFKGKHMDHMTKAKAQLVMDQPFFASLLLGMPMEEDNRIPTMATNGEWIKYNKKFMETLTLQQTLFILAHEVLHCVFQHMHRREARNHNKWNIAADYVINDLLVKDGIGSMPPMGLLNPQLVIDGKGTTEGVYNLLPDSDESKQAGEPGQGGSMDVVDDASQDQAEMSQKMEEMKVKIVQAQNAAKIAGKLSANLQRLIGDYIKTTVDWRAILRNFITQRAKVDLSYAKPKRRFLAEDIYLPSLSGEALGTIVVAIDCSGSVSPELLKKFAGEVKGIIEDTAPEMTHVIYFDSEVLRQDNFSRDEEFQVYPVGGGGTAFSPIFKSIEKQGIEPACCVVLTDLYCSDYGPQPGYPVLFASTDATEGNPWGEVIKIK